MRAKKWIAMMAAGAMVVSMLAGCANSGNAGNAGNTSVQSAETDQTAQETAAEAGTDQTAGEAAETVTQAEGEALQGGKALVVYYSASGHTEAVANAIAAAAGADLFKLESAEPYSSDDLNYRDENSRVSQEHEHEEMRDVELVSTAVENWDSYDTVFIGYPIWWGIAAWPVDSFVEENDFTGKTVIPFCTSASSGLGESGELLAEKAGTGNWQEGIRFSSGAAEEEVKSWVSELGLGQ